jgi:ribosomal protein S18 acetylase RimI-like enzyme
MCRWTPTAGDMGPSCLVGDVRKSSAMPIFIRDADMTDMEDLQGVFRRASLSNEGDRGPLLEHPEWLVLSNNAVLEGRMRVAMGDHGALVGLATYLVSDGLAELEDLFVDPPWMRHGVGTALVVDISARLNELRFKTLEVTANPHAMAFYEHLGFVEVRIVDTQFYPAPRMIRPTRGID